MGVKLKFLTIVLTMCLILCLTGIVSAAGMTDISGHWAQTQMEKWVTNGLVSGYPDGTFKPNKEVSRAEFVTLVNRAFKKQNKDAQCNFSDVKASDWFYREVASGKAAGYISGYPDGTFKPDKSISRQEAAAIIVKLLNLNTDRQDAINNFKDVDSFPAWSKAGINAVVGNKIMSSYPDGTFKAQNLITRAEAVVTLDRALATKVSPPVAYEGIKGTVIMKSQPVEGATVKLFAKDGYEILEETTTDKDGKYEFAAADGIYDLTAAKEGNVGYASDVTVVEGNATTQELSLIKGIKISVKLLDKSNKPFANVKVFLTTNPTFVTTTDKNGNFSINILPDRQYSVRSFVPGKESEGIKNIASDVSVGSTDKGLGSLNASFSIGSSGGGGGSPGGASGDPTDEPAESGNHTPEIDLIELSRHLYPGESTIITAYVYDEDGDELTCTWDASGGTLSDTTGTSIEWTAPESLDEYTITLTVSDGQGGSANQSETITVAEPLYNTLDLPALEPDKDEDGDGLTNAQESEYGTDPYEIDSDYDDLDDPEEIDLGTDPNDSDTDDDGLIDGAEVKLGSDPLAADSDNNGTPDGEENFSSTIKLEGEYPATVTLRGTGNLAAADISLLDNPLLTSFAGSAGEAIEIYTPYSIDSSTVGIVYKDEELQAKGINLEDLQVYSINFNTGNFEPLTGSNIGTVNNAVYEDTVNGAVYGDTVNSAVYGHFPSFCLGTTDLDQANLFDQRTIIALDMSQDMKKADFSRSYPWKEGLKNIIQEFGNQTQACVLQYSNGLNVWTEFTSDKELLNYDIEDLMYLDNPLPVDFLSLYQESLQKLENAAGPGQPGRSIIIVTAGYDTSQHEQAVNLATQAKAEGIKTYIIDMSADQSQHNKLKELVQITGGRYYDASTKAGITLATGEIKADFLNIMNFNKSQNVGIRIMQSDERDRVMTAFNPAVNGWWYKNAGTTAFPNHGICAGMTVSAMLTYLDLLPVSLQLTENEFKNLNKTIYANNKLDEAVKNNTWYSLTSVGNFDDVFINNRLHPHIYLIDEHAGKKPKDWTESATFDLQHLWQHFQAKSNNNDKWQFPEYYTVKNNKKPLYIKKDMIDILLDNLNSGLPVPTGVAKNNIGHSVLAYGYEAENKDKYGIPAKITVYIYDPNYPGKRKEMIFRTVHTEDNETNSYWYSFEYCPNNKEGYKSVYENVDIVHKDIGFFDTKTYLDVQAKNPLNIVGVEIVDEYTARIKFRGNFVGVVGQPYQDYIIKNLHVYIKNLENGYVGSLLGKYLSGNDFERANLSFIDDQTLEIKINTNEGNRFWDSDNAGYYFYVANNKFDIAKSVYVGKPYEEKFNSYFQSTAYRSHKVKNFSDVPEAYWAARAIKHVGGEDIMEGYPDGKFHYADNLTRAELVTLAMRWAGKDISIDTKYNLLSSEQKRKFNDLNDHWARKYIRLAAAEDWLFKVDQNSFKPNEEVTREEAAYTISKIKGYNTRDASLNTRYVDNEQIDKEYRKDIKYLKDKLIMTGRPTGEHGIERKFAPRSFLTRAEIAKLIYNADTSE